MRKLRDYQQLWIFAPGLSWIVVGGIVVLKGEKAGWVPLVAGVGLTMCIFLSAVMPPIHMPNWLKWIVWNPLFHSVLLIGMGVFMYWKQPNPFAVFLILVGIAPLFWGLVFRK